MPTNHIPIPIDEMSEFLAVDPTSSTGLRWVQSPSWSVKEGDDAGAMGDNGHFQIKFRGRNYKASRVVYAIHHVVDPGLLEVVHIDGDGRNNTTSNLMLMHHRKHRRSTPKKSGLPIGVCMVKRRNKPYTSHITVNGKLHYLGNFLTPEEAAAAYQKALAELAVKSSVAR